MKLAGTVQTKTTIKKPFESKFSCLSGPKHIPSKTEQCPFCQITCWIRNVSLRKVTTTALLFGCCINVIYNLISLTRASLKFPKTVLYKHKAPLIFGAVNRSRIGPNVPTDFYSVSLRLTYSVQSGCKIICLVQKWADYQGTIRLN